jgi:hypothetical protein
VFDLCVARFVIMPLECSLRTGISKRELGLLQRPLAHKTKVCRACIADLILSLALSN